MKNSFVTLIVVCIVVALVGALVYVLVSGITGNENITPPNTNTGVDGFLPPAKTGDEENLVRIDTPEPYELISSPVTITGSARGFWFFEASFPITLLDDKGKIIGRAVAQAQDEWMTENFVPFRAVLTFNPGSATEGTLVLEKDNPSGLPENADAISLLVRFAKVTENRALDGCVISGCSGEVCGESDVVTPCIYRESYACYVSAICELGDDGTCGWRKTPELTQCIESQPF